MSAINIRLRVLKDTNSFSADIIDIGAHHSPAASPPAVDAYHKQSKSWRPLACQIEQSPKSRRAISAPGLSSMLYRPCSSGEHLKVAMRSHEMAQVSRHLSVDFSCITTRHDGMGKGINKCENNASERTRLYAAVSKVYVAIDACMRTMFFLGTLRAAG